MLTPTTPPFEYEIVRGKRKTVAIHVQNGTVQVRAPLRVSKQWINEFVSSQTNWVLKRLHKEAQTTRSHIELTDGTTLPFLGSTLLLRILPAKRSTAQLSDGTLTLMATSLDADHIKKIFVTWLKKQASEYMIPRSLALAAQLGLDHKISLFRFRITRSTWGHCSSKGIIQFNPLIMLMMPELVDYLIAHEVCHLQHMNHSTEFRKLLTKSCPDSKAHEKALKNSGRSLYF